MNTYFFIEIFLSFSIEIFILREVKNWIMIFFYVINHFICNKSSIQNLPTNNKSILVFHWTLLLSHTLVSVKNLSYDLIKPINKAYSLEVDKKSCIIELSVEILNKRECYYLIIGIITKTSYTLVCFLFFV